MSSVNRSMTGTIDLAGNTDSTIHIGFRTEISSRSDAGIYRLNLPSHDTHTLVAQLHLGLDDCSLRINVGELWASFESDQVMVRVTGECVRVLAAYAVVRRDESYTDGGWLTAPESHQRWLDLGGNPASGIERLGFERGKLRSQLRKAGVMDVKDLFERKTSGYRTMLVYPSRLTKFLFSMTWIEIRVYFGKIFVGF